MQGKLETLYTERGNYDTRKVLNLSKTSITTETLEAIEANGVTLEQLNDLGVPVCKYKTQITLHGVFPELNAGRVGGYKCLVRNLNGSLGVRYIAVDHAKKHAVYSALHAEGWHIQKNSSEYFAFFSFGVVTEKAELLKQVETLKEKSKTLNTALFYGSLRVTAYGLPYGGYYSALVLDLGCLPAGNEAKIVLNVTGKTVEQIAAEVAAKEEKRKAENAIWRAQYDKEQAEKAIARANELEAIAKLNGLLFHASAPLAPGVYLVQGSMTGHWYVRLLHKDKRGTFRRASVEYHGLQEAIVAIKAGKLPKAHAMNKPVTKPMSNVYTLPNLEQGKESNKQVWRPYIY
jgi:hypothetical protein